VKRVYVCSPLAGDIEGNMEKAKNYCREAMEHGVLPIAVHVYFPQFLDDNNPIERESGMKMGLELLKLCDEVWVYGDTISSGMAREIEFANEIGIQVVHKLNEGNEFDNDKEHIENCAGVDFVPEHNNDSVCALSY